MKIPTKDPKVIQFDPNRLPATPKPNEHYCGHKQVLVCETSRMLECGNCGQMIDPFDFMWQWANRDRNLHWSREALKKDIARLSEQLEELKREEKNARARLKRLKEV